MKNILFIALILLASCGSKAPADSTQLRVVATTAMIADIVQAVGGEEVFVDTLIGEGLDPHSYEFVKGDEEKLFDARLVFYNGLGLEHGASLCRWLKNSPHAVGLGDLILKQEPSAIIHSASELDPHIWMDVALFARSVPFIEQALCEADPEHAAQYRQRAAQLSARLQQLDRQVREEIAHIPPQCRYLVTCHDAFHYFVRAYFNVTDWQNHCFAPEGLAPDGQISLSDLRTIISQIKRHAIPVVFVEEAVNRDAIERIVTVAKGEGVTVSIAEKPLYSDTLGPKESQAALWEGMVLYNAQVIREGLQ